MQFSPHTAYLELASSLTGPGLLTIQLYINQGSHKPLGFSLLEWLTELWEAQLLLLIKDTTIELEEKEAMPFPTQACLCFYESFMI